MIEETQMQSMEVLSRLISSVYRTKGGFQFRKFIFWEKRFPYLSLFSVVSLYNTTFFSKKKPGNLSEYILKNFQILSIFLQG